MVLMKLSTLRFGNVLKTLKKNAERTYYTYVNEPAMYIPGKEPSWVTAQEALDATLQSDMSIFISGAAATPTELLDAMVETGVKKKLNNIKLYHMHLEGEGKFANSEVKDIFRSVSLFMGHNVRTAVNEGRADNLSLFLHEIPLLFSRKIVQPHISLIHVSPPDRHGYCTLGTSVDCVRSAIMHSKVIVALVNPHMPRTFSDAIVHQSHLDYAVKIDRPLPEQKAKPPNPVEEKIGKLIADFLIEDGATLQMGIGAIPDAVLAQLGNHKNLGIHTELFSDGVVDLVMKGCITNNMKPLHKGRTVGSFLNGTKKLYNFVHDNPSVEMLRVDYVNSTKIISQMPRMTAINSAIEIDITGQVNSDSIGTRMFSGFGGQVDFIRGSAEGFDGLGKPIIALASKTNKGVSKIVNMLKPGAGVVTSRAHVHYIVTEHGIASLFGKSIRQRAYEMIQIAAPEHRETLEKEAFVRLKCMPSA